MARVTAIEIGIYWKTSQRLDDFLPLESLGQDSVRILLPNRRGLTVRTVIEEEGSPVIRLQQTGRKLIIDSNIPYANPWVTPFCEEVSGRSEDFEISKLHPHRLIFNNDGHPIAYRVFPTQDNEGTFSISRPRFGLTVVRLNDGYLKTNWDQIFMNWETVGEQSRKF